MHQLVPARRCDEEDVRRGRLNTYAVCVSSAACRGPRHDSALSLLPLAMHSARA